MASPLLKKALLWADTDRGLKSRLSSDAHNAVTSREDIPELVKERNLSRGERLQRLRLRHYPTIDVDHERLYAGYVEDGLEPTREALYSAGFRDNPTAYVEVSDELGPDSWSFARQYITEMSGGKRIPHLSNRVRLYRREKRQYHVVAFEVREDDPNREMFSGSGDITVLYAHEERSAWLQPMRHVNIPDSTAEVGIRELRDIWYDEHGYELPGKGDVIWDTTH